MKKGTPMLCSCMSNYSKTNFIMIYVQAIAASMETAIIYPEIMDMFPSHIIKNRSLKVQMYS